MKEVDLTDGLSAIYGLLAMTAWVIIPIGTFLTVVAAGLAVRLVW